MDLKLMPSKAVRTAQSWASCAAPRTGCGFRCINRARLHNSQAKADFAIATLRVMGDRIQRGFDLQMETVVTRHMPSPELQAWAVEHPVRAFIAVYAALSAVALGNLCRLSDALVAPLRPKPGVFGRYVHRSNIIELITLDLRPKRCGPF